MKFFLPGAIGDEALAEETYASIAKHVTKTGMPVQATRYYSISFEHDGRQENATVGEAFRPLSGEPVVAIFRAVEPSGPYFVCTYSRGVVHGGPYMADGGIRTQAVAFDH